MRHQKSRQKEAPSVRDRRGGDRRLGRRRVVAAVRHYQTGSRRWAASVHLPHAPESYIGVYSPEAPDSYARGDGVQDGDGGHARCQPCTTAAGSRVSRPASRPPRPARARCRWCRSTRITSSLASIAAGKYDGFLSKYASEVRTYRHPVILSFGHEMNGNWYSWGYRHTSPAVFVAAWRHIVTIFRAIGASNVTWLWTVNIMDTQHGRIPAPAPGGRAASM